MGAEMIGPHQGEGACRTAGGVCTPVVRLGREQGLSLDPRGLVGQRTHCADRASGRKDRRHRAEGHTCVLAGPGPGIEVGAEEEETCEMADATTSEKRASR